MIGLDTNILARYYIDDLADAQARRQQTAARMLIESGQALMVCKTVLLELEWLMRGHYAFKPAQVLSVLKHLLGLRHVSIEDRTTIEQTVISFEAGLDFADALHHASYRSCTGMASFDDRKFVRRAQRLGLSPTVAVPRQA